MSDTTVLSAALPPSHGPTPRAAASRAPDDGIDLYSETQQLFPQNEGGDSVENWFGKDGFDFKDLLDIVNPLQHLPVVGTLYRALTGDALSPGSRIIGGTLFGGIAGFVTSLANAIYEDETGKDFGATALALITDDGAPGPAVASAAAAGAAPASSIPAVPTAAKAAITPTAPSPLAIAGHARPSGTPLAAPGGGTEDPVSALINARAAVPVAHSPGITGLPATNYRASLKMPDGKSVPIRFGPKPALAAPHTVHAAHTAAPAQEKAVAAAAAPATPRAASTAPRPLQPAAGRATSAAAQQTDQIAAAESMADVPVLMRKALDKYEALMKSRTAPSISGKI